MLFSAWDLTTPSLSAQEGLLQIIVGDTGIINGIIVSLNAPISVELKDGNLMYNRLMLCQVNSDTLGDGGFFRLARHLNRSLALAK